MTLRSRAVSDVCPGEKGFVAFERRDRTYAKRTDGLCKKENVSSIICTPNRAMLNPCAASVFHNENLASGLSAVGPEL